MTTSERGFEDAIEESLLAGGYLKSRANNFDRALGLDTVELFAFIEATQPKTWADLCSRGYGGDAAAAKTGFAKRLAAELDLRGTVDVLRHGVTDYGVEIRLAYFKPAHGLTPDLQDRYEANRVSVTRQFKYETGSDKSIDLALLVNGIPTATAELKNPLTHQTVDHAMEQYRDDRDPGNVTLSMRAIVHFAVDPDNAMMTTRLDGARTRFLPFNQGSGGAGRQGGAGNPPSTTGHRTAYLWQDVWAQDAWLDILARFVHVEVPAKGSKAQKRKQAVTIFPRFHQWDAVRKLEEAAKADGAGTSYLVQHSAGSGKSNTIGWICHRLANLHNAFSEKVFDKVVVITDRVILDQQLQDTIYQFEHAKGVVVKIDQNSDQLAEALSGEQAKIIITTLQKFPFVLGKIGDMPMRRYAVVVDEAHSSQTGETARDLRRVLGDDIDEDEMLLKAEELDAEDESSRGDGEDQLVASVAGRGRQDNISFFAFTATPKAKTLELFGHPDTSSGEKRFVPFHLYSMRQAIEEGFIHDVLKDYTTYQTYWRIEKAIRDDPEFDPVRAKAAIARFVSLHPTNLAQKAEVIVEHFRQHTAHKINGRAKAMVVTASRLHAVRYKQAIDRYIAEHGYTDVAALVAFSGKVIDEGDEFTEPGMNKFPESETREKFDTDDYQVLIVAEKFQTGFDQPLLHTMYVDKVLTGLNAVQTLSRLNRICSGKDDTFVLDFRNETDDIKKAFQPWYERTEAIPTDPNLLWDAHRELMASSVIHEDEIEPAVREILAGRNAKNHAAVYASLDPALTRFLALDDEDQDEFRDTLKRFISLYGFIAQIVDFTDATLERDSIYARMLQARLPPTGQPGIDLGSEIELTHLRTEKTSEGSIELEPQGEIGAVFDGRGPQHEPEPERLSTIIEALNERFGLAFDERDALLFEQYEETWLNDPAIIAQARNNLYDNFILVFERQFMNTIIKRMDANEEIFKRILDDDEFKQVLLDMYARRIFEQLQRNAS
jgi:type I restriction enzyme R subunit